jgi:hypothetical protein
VDRDYFREIDQMCAPYIQESNERGDADLAHRLARRLRAAEKEKRQLDVPKARLRKDLADARRELESLSVKVAHSPSG